MGCRQIQLLAIGPDIHAGLVSDVSRTIPDITPTIGELLGFSTEDATGSPMFELIDATASTNDGSQAMTPNDPRLSRVFPTPFNGQLTIEYQLSLGSEGELNIFSLQGELVWSKGLYSRSAGLNSLRWQGLNFYNQPLPSGLYIIQLSTTDGISSKKVLLLK